MQQAAYPRRVGMDGKVPLAGLSPPVTLGDRARLTSIYPNGQRNDVLRNTPALRAAN